MDLIDKKGYKFAIGIDENTSLSIEDDIGTVIGENGVYFFDFSNAEIIL